MTTVRLRLNGPLVIESEDVTVVDWNGKPYTITRRPVALCRCGASARKPFCDGSHARVGFDGGAGGDGGTTSNGSDGPQGPASSAP